MKERLILFAICGVLFVYIVTASSTVYAQKSSNAIVIDSNTGKIYVSNSENNMLSVIDSKTNKLVANIPMGDQHVAVFNTDTVTPWATIAVTIGAVVTAIIGIRSYTQGQIVNKKDIQKDIVIPLIKEHDESKEMQLAKLILDNVEISSPDLTKDYPYGFYTKERLSITLQDHNKPLGPWDKGDGEVRSSFDSLLDFFSRLDYLKSALGISAPVGFVTVYYSRKTQKSNELQLNFQTTIKAFEMLSGDENKARWRKIYAEYWRLKSQKKPIVFEGDIKIDAYAIREKLNQIGVLYVAGALSKKILLDTYDSVFIRLWISMEDDIKEDRIRNPEASRFFEIMYKEATADWERKHIIDPKMYPDRPTPYTPTFDSNGNVATRV